MVSTKASPSPVPLRTLRRPGYADGAALLLLFALTLVAEWGLLVGGTILGQDSATFFYPMYSFLGEQLRGGNIPGWNPHQFSGAPFAADPQSGWMYLPAMLLFTLLPLAAAAKGYMFLHLLVAGLGTYALARALRMDVAGALIAAVAYEFTGFLYTNNVCCFAYTGVATWLPIPILCAEMAIRSSAWATRALWWALGGLALSQILAQWLGQGSYYALMALGGYIGYRTLIAPPETIAGSRGRVAAFLVNNIGMLLFAFALAAGGVLPRLEYNALSNLAGGYPPSKQYVSGGWNAGGWNVSDWLRLLERGATSPYAGGATVALAVVAPIVARRRHAVPYFAALSVAALILTSQGPTPLHSLLYELLPRFAHLHARHPERVTMTLYLGIALLAGATWSSLPSRGRRAALAALLPAVGLLWLRTRQVAFPPATSNASAAALVLLGAAALLPARRQLLTLLMLLVLSVDLLAADKGIVEARMRLSEHHAFRKVDIENYYKPTDAARFLLERDREEPSRFFGFDPGAARWARENNLPEWRDPRESKLLFNNRATSVGLQDVQGYDPVHLRRYDEYMAALNGAPERHWFITVFGRGPTSPLLDLLNARYVLIPDTWRPDPHNLLQLDGPYQDVYEDKELRVLQRSRALPRAWVVHSARQVKPGEALPLLQGGELDPARIALLERPPPPLDRPRGGGNGRATVLEHTPDRVRLRTDTTAAGLLVLSEVYYPAWKVYVDGRQAPVYVTDHILRGVPVPAGVHEVELRYESATLDVGVMISLATYLLLAVLLIRTGTRNLPASWSVRRS